MTINPKYKRTGKSNPFQKHEFILDTADTIFLANYFIGYFGVADYASQLMKLQKRSDLEKRKLWENYKNPFKSEDVIDKNKDFGINVYCCGQSNDQRKKEPEYMKLLHLTSSHINYGGWRCFDYLVCLTHEHQSCKIINSPPPFDEFVLGFITLDSGVLNNKPIQEYLGQGKLMSDFVNAHIVNAKTIIPTQPFGSLLRGGKLISLIAQSNELRDHFNQQYGANVVLFYTTSLYGSTKSRSQYDQLNRYLTYIGKTQGSHLLRMKEPHCSNIIQWLDDRGISKYNFLGNGSSKADKTFTSLHKYLEDCLRGRQSDPTVKQLYQRFKYEMKQLEEVKTERKRCYVSTYGMECWDDNLIGLEREVKEQNNLEFIFNYWKNKVFKKKDWGLRKYREILDNPIKLKYDLLNDKLKEPDFQIVR